MTYYVIHLLREDAGIKVSHFTEYESKGCKTSGVRGPSNPKAELVFENLKGLMSKLNADKMLMNLEVL